MSATALIAVTTGCWPAAPRAWPPTRASPPIPAPGRKAWPPRRSRAQRPAADRRAQERPVVARLHVEGVRRRRSSPRPRRQAGLRELRRRPRPGQRRRRDAEHRRGARPVEQTPQDAGPLVFTTGIGPAVVDAAAGLAVAGRRRRAAEPPRRRRRPPRHRHVEPDRLPRPLGPPGDARPGAVPVRRRPGRQPRRHLATTPPPTAPTPSRRATRAYDNAHAASDIERLRSLWDVPAVALIGIGNGAQVALAYAGSHPDKVARLILDSPVALGINAEAAAEQQVKGQQAALDAFAAQCVAVNCALGPDPKGAVTALLADARAGKAPGGASVAAVTNAITIALGFPIGDRVGATTSLANALAARPLRRRQPAQQPDQPRRHHPGHRRPVRQLLQRRAQPPHPGPGSRTRGRLGQALSAVRHGRRAQPGQVRALAHRLAAGKRRKISRSTCCLLGVQNDPIVGLGRRRRDSGHHHQRQRGQQAGDVAGHRPRRQHLFVVCRPADASATSTAASCPEPTPTVPPDTWQRSRRCTVRW